MSIKKRQGRNSGRLPNGHKTPRIINRQVEPRPSSVNQISISTSTMQSASSRVLPIAKLISPPYSAVADYIPQSSFPEALSDTGLERSSNPAEHSSQDQAPQSPLSSISVSTAAQSPQSAHGTDSFRNMSTHKGRPYRSHKYPACVRCHKRRSRCTVEIPGQPCLLCRMHGVPCSSATNKIDDRSIPRVGFVRRSLLSEKEESFNEMGHIVGPLIARDTHVLEHYLPSTEANNGSSLSINPTTNPGSSQKPIYHAMIPPRRPSPTECVCSRNLPGELFDRVEPFVDKLAALYFEHLHMCFPIIEESCISSKIKEKPGLSLPLSFLCNFHAYSLFHWDLSPALAPYARPDQDFAWQVAQSTVNTELQKSDLAVIISTSLNIAGRPSTCLVGNTVNVARVVALSHSIGLNHDCSEWKISSEEKRVRHKTWWSVVIHDRWFNFAHGTPPHITSGQYDAPIPTVDIITEGKLDSIKCVRAAECYIALCRLTEIIGDILPLIYHIRSGNDSMASEKTTRSEMELNRWVENLPAWLQLHEFDARPSIPGLVNLQLSYLSVRMLLRRIAWHEVSQREGDPHSSWLLGCQAAADEMVRFIGSLGPQDLQGFWLPYNAHHFTSAVTLLLRCALQTTYAEIRQGCMKSARELVDHLRKFKEENNWDLADTSLAQSESVLKKIEDALPMTPPLKTKQASIDMSGGLATNGLEMTNYLGNPASRIGNPSWQTSIEDLFPEFFSEFTDTALFDGSHLDG